MISSSDGRKHRTAPHRIASHFGQDPRSSRVRLRVRLRLRLRVRLRVRLRRL
jgi:hypothetical protein